MSEAVNKLMETLQNIKVEFDGGIALVTMNRPKAMNALNNQTLTELEQIFDTLDKAPEVKGFIITGEGKAFVAGADISQMQPYKAEEGRDYAGYAQSVFNKIESCTKPVIAAVNGYALGGGCELSMACDIRIASEKAQFGQPEVKLGVIACFGGTQRLPRLVGPGIAKELLFTGRMVSPEEALRFGLVNKVVAPEELIEEAKTMLRGIMEMAPLAVKYSKLVVNRGMDMDLMNALEFEKDVCGLTFGSQDKQEGMDAFLEKRKPKFQNK